MPPGRRVDAVTLVFVNERGTPFTTAGFARIIDCAARRPPNRFKQFWRESANRASSNGCSAGAAVRNRFGLLGDEANGLKEGQLSVRSVLGPG
jgi:hypothetical protein